jgi:hypothetical protein
MKRKITFLIAALFALTLITQPMKVVGQTRTVLFHETFGSNTTSSAREWENSYSVKSGVAAVYTNVGGYTMTNLKQGKNTVGYGPNSAALQQTTTGTDAQFESGPYNLSGYSSLNVTYYWNAASINATYYTKLYYKTSANGTYTEVSGSGTGATSYVQRSYSLPDACQVSTLYLKVVFNTSNTNAKIDEFEITGTAVTPADPTLTIATPTGGTIAVANATTPVSSGSTVAAGTSLTLSNEPSTGYSFSTWNVYKTGDQSTTVIVSNNSFTMPSYNTTVSATFTKNNYSVTLGTPEVDLTATDYDAITIEEGETESVPYGTELVLEAGSLTDGKMLAWKVIKTGVSPEEDVTNDVLSDVSADAALLTVPDYDITISGTVEDIKYYVSYNANGGTGTLTDPNSPYTSGSNVTVLANTFTYSGHVFKNWKDGDDEYDPGDVISGISKNITLYAQWADAWTVTFNSNAVTTIQEVEKTNSISLTAPDNVPSGYSYKGWTATPSNPANMVSTPYTPTANVTLYAVFAKTVQEYGESVFVLDGSNYNNGDYTYSSGTKDQALQSNPTNNFSSNSAIFIPQNGGYIYNKNAFGSEITKFEIYASNGGSSTATVGIYFSANSFSTTPTGDYTWTSASGGIGTDAVIDASSSIPNNTKYFYFVSTKSNKNAQVQIRITYIAPIYYTRIYPSGNVTPDEDMTITTPTVISNGTVLDMGTHTLSIGAGGSLTIEDGGQLITSSSVQLTYKKGITSAAKADGGWYTISTPVHTASNTFLEHESVENLILASPSNYDLFYYDEPNHYWMNYKQAEFDLNIGQGYLYRNNGAELHFAGYNNQAAYYEKALSYASSEDKLLGFNLIGNPYPQNITMSDVTVNNGGTLSGGYVLSKDGAWSADVAATIAPAQGFLVQIDKTGVTATITKPTGGSKSRANNDYIKFIVANSQHEDAAFALFDEGYGLNKIDHRNSDIPMLYIPKEGHNFAIATMADNTQSFNLNLKAKTTGKYTLSYKATGNYSYLHVIDRLTGEDVDMLLDGEYSFIASPSDAENRFIVRLEYMNGLDNSENSIFAYQSGSDIIVNGEGELQIFDMMGRRVSTQYVSGVETINLQSHGVYIFKLNEKTQKIVVR